MRVTFVPPVVGLLAVSGGAFAQSFNIEFGAPGSAPASTYAAAGLPGVWNTYDAMAFGQRFPLVDIGGEAVSAMIYNIGGTGMMSAGVPGASGDDDALVADAMTSLNNPLDTCIFFEGLTNGEYEVLLYAITPGQPGATNRVSVDHSPQGFQFIGGAWPGAHQEGVTYARFTVTVTDGRMGMHSGQFGLNALSALNGIQIRLLVECEGDANGDNQVNFTDLNAVLSDFGQSGAVPGDINGDGTVNFTDLNIVMSKFGNACD